jgi:hypothetical protein
MTTHPSHPLLLLEAVLMWVVLQTTETLTVLVALVHLTLTEARDPVLPACLQVSLARCRQASLLPRLATHLHPQELPVLALLLRLQGTWRLQPRHTTLRLRHDMVRLHRRRTRRRLQPVTPRHRLSTHQHRPTTARRPLHSWAVLLHLRTARRRHNTARPLHSTVLQAHSTRQAAIVALLPLPHPLNTAQHPLDTRPLARLEHSPRPLRDIARLLRVRRTLPHLQSNRRLVDVRLSIPSLFYMEICSLLWMIWINSLLKLSKLRRCLPALLFKDSTQPPTHPITAGLVRQVVSVSGRSFN